MKSTGPRTPKGRAVSSKNALKHGILSREVLVRGQFLQEDEKELEALHVRFQDELQPDGPLEEMLVDQIVTGHWRLRRALTAESGEIALSVDAGRRRLRGTDPVLQWMKWTAFGDPVYAMEQDPVGIRMLLNWLREVRADVEREGELTDGAMQKLAAHFGDKPNSLELALRRFRRKQAAQAARDDALPGGQRKEEALTFLDQRLRSLELFRDMNEAEREYAAEAQQAAAVLPSAAVLEKIMRYETKLERQIFRAMAQLERVQRMRRGESIPAPLSVNISARD